MLLTFIRAKLDIFLNSAGKDKILVKLVTLYTSRCFGTVLKLRLQGMASMCIYLQNQEEQSACDVLNVSPSVSKLIFLKVQLLKVKSSQSFVFVFILKLKLKRGLQKDTHKVWTLGLFFPKKYFSPLSSQNANCKGFPNLLWLVQSESFLPLFCLTSQTIQCGQCDASYCCECIHCLLTLTFLKALYMHPLIWSSA